LRHWLKWWGTTYLYELDSTLSKEGEKERATKKMRWKMRELREIRWKRELENRSTKKMMKFFKWEIFSQAMRWRRSCCRRKTLKVEEELSVCWRRTHKGKRVTIYYNLIFLFYFSWWDPLFRKMEQSITSVVAWCAQVCMLTWGVW
jgi:hypothetical protein